MSGAEVFRTEHRLYIVFRRCHRGHRPTRSTVNDILFSALTTSRCDTRRFDLCVEDLERGPGALCQNAACMPVQVKKCPVGSGNIKKQPIHELLGGLAHNQPYTPSFSFQLTPNLVSAEIMYISSEDECEPQTSTHATVKLRQSISYQ